MSSRSVPVLRMVALLCLPCVAAYAGEPAREELPELTVSALAVREDASNVASPFSLIDADRLFRDGATTLGDALGSLPGVQADSFGGGASRPVIRGQAPPRVALLADGGTLFDAASVSPDHAVTIEPLLARRIEVLRGPATLLYGSGAIGGVVNVLDHRVPESVPEKPVSGQVAMRGNTATGELSGAFEIDGALSPTWAAHLEAYARDTDDYHAPGQAGSRVPATWAQSKGGSAGLTKAGEWGHLGVALSWMGSDYGLPGHDHHEDDDHDHGDHDHDDHDHADDHDHEAPFVDLASRRFDLRGALLDPLPGIARLRLRASFTDYQHHEREGADIATTFTNEGGELRVEAEHVPLGRWVGVLGLQHSNTRSGAVGEEAFVPVTRQRSTGVFLVEHFEVDERWHLELGARQEWTRLAPRDDADLPAYSDSTLSLSAAAVWQFADDYNLSLTASRSERAPYAQELYARGAHLATDTWECGLLQSADACGPRPEASPGAEVARNVELLLRRTQGRVTFSLGAYRNDVDDYVHAHTLGEHEGFRLVQYTARDARFTGFEAEMAVQLGEVFTAELFGDRVRARFDDGSGNLPRIPAARVGARLLAGRGGFGGGLEWIHVARQDAIADYESATPGHDLVNLWLSWTPAAFDRLTVFARGSNLLDEAAYNHASFLADSVPQPGRGASVGVRLAF